MMSMTSMGNINLGRSRNTGCYSGSPDTENIVKLIYHGTRPFPFPYSTTVPQLLQLCQSHSWGGGGGGGNGTRTCFIGI